MKATYVKIFVISIISVILIIISGRIYAVNDITTTKYTIEENYIKQIKAIETVRSFLNNILTNNNEELHVYKEQGIVSDEDKICTGMTLKVGFNSYKIVVIGDVNGDGKNSSVDLSIQMKVATNIEKLEGEYLKAADLNNDGKTEITAVDLSLMKMLLVGLDFSGDGTSSGDDGEEWEEGNEDDILVKMVPETASKEIEVLIRWPKNVEGLTKQVSIDNGKTFINNIDRISVTRNDNVIARLVDETLTPLKEKAVTVSNIDVVMPDEFEFVAMATSYSIMVNARTQDVAADSEGNFARTGIAGVSKYLYSLDGENWYEHGNFSNLDQNSYYNVYVKAVDYAGNERFAINNGSIVVTSMAEEAVNVVNFEYSTLNYTKESVTVRINSDKLIDKSCTVEYQVLDLEEDEKDLKDNWKTGDLLIVEKNSKIYVRIVNARGETNPNGGYAIGEVRNIDRTLPTISNMARVINDSANEFTVRLNIQDDCSGLSKIIWYYKLITDKEYSTKINMYEEPNGMVQGDPDANITETINKAKSGVYEVYAEVYDVAGNMQSNEIALTGGIDITYFVTGKAAAHQHIFESKYDATNHWEECILCNPGTNKRNNQKHTMVLIGNGPTCDVYVSLGNYVCRDGCGYAVPVKPLEHIRPTPIIWTNWKNGHHYQFQCNRCGGSGGNGLGIYHSFNIGGKVMTLLEMKNAGINPHKYGTLKCTGCRQDIDLSKHTFYSNDCRVCLKILGPEGKIKTTGIDLVNNVTQYIYIEVDTKGLQFDYTRVMDLNNTGLYNVGEAERTAVNGNIWTYRVPVSLINRNVPITTDLRLIFNWYATGVTNKVYEGYGCSNNSNFESWIYVKTDLDKPTISNITAVDEKSMLYNGVRWSTSKRITVTGTSKMNKIVYVSMYKKDGTVIFKDSGCEVNNNRYTFSTLPNFEANEATEFIIEVKDDFGNATRKSVTFSHIDSKYPAMTSPSAFTDGWKKRRIITFGAKDEGIGKVQMAFNNEKDMVFMDQKGTDYSKQYIIEGDVYSPKQLTLYFKDALGNITTELIEISNIDNTAPTIEDVTKEKVGSDTKLTVVANDVNYILRESGSGIIKYAITTNNYRPEENSSLWQESNEFIVSENNTYYLWVLDRAGNISNAEIVKIME